MAVILVEPKAEVVERLDAGRVKAVRKRRMTVRMENLSFILFSSFIGTSFLEFLVALFEQYGIGTHPYLVKFFIQKIRFPETLIPLTTINTNHLQILSSFGPGPIFLFFREQRGHFELEFTITLYET